MAFTGEPAAHDRSPPTGRWWLASAAVAVATFALSSLPANELARAPVQIWDKAAHAATWAVLGYCVARALARRRLGVAAHLAAAVLIGTVWGVGDELHQSFVPGRDSSALDVVADLIGATLGGALGIAHVRRRRADADRLR